MYWQYMHILLQSRHYTAHCKTYTSKYIRIQQSTYCILHGSIWYVLCRICEVYDCTFNRNTCIFISRYINVYAQKYIHILICRITDAEAASQSAKVQAHPSRSAPSPAPQAHRAAQAEAQDSSSECSYHLQPRVPSKARQIKWVFKHPT